MTMTRCVLTDVDAGYAEGGATPDLRDSAAASGRATMPERKAEGSYRQAACTRQGTSTKWNAVDFVRMH